MEPNRWWIMSIRAAFLESEPTWYHGAVGVSVWTIISSLAREYSSHLVMDSRSMGESFHWRSGSFRRFWKRSYCTLSDTENQYLRRWMLSSTSIGSKRGHAALVDAVHAAVPHLRADARGGRHPPAQVLVLRVRQGTVLSLIHISEPTRLGMI